MYLKHWIIAAAFLAVAYAAAIEPLDLTAIEDQSQDVQHEQPIRQKRFILAKKAFLLGGAAGLGLGLAKGAYFAPQPVYYYSYPVYSYPAYPSYGYGGGGGGGGYSEAHAYASSGGGAW